MAGDQIWKLFGLDANTGFFGGLIAAFLMILIGALKALMMYGFWRIDQPAVGDLKKIPITPFCCWKNQQNRTTGYLDRLLSQKSWLILANWICFPILIQ